MKNQIIDNSSSLKKNSNHLVLCEDEGKWRYYMNLGKDIFNRTKVIHQSSGLIPSLESMSNISVLIIDYEKLGIKGIINMVNEVNKSYPDIHVIILIGHSLNSYSTINSLLDKEKNDMAIKPISSKRLIPMMIAMNKIYEKQNVAQDYLAKNLNMQGSESIKSQAKKFWNGLTHIIHENKEQKEILNKTWNADKDNKL